MSTTNPVLVIYKAKNCNACKQYESKWNNISHNLKQKFQLRTVTIEGETITRPDYDTTKIPGGLRKYGHWFPMLILIPGPVWNNAMDKLPNTVELKGIQIINTKRDKSNDFVRGPGNRILIDEKYNIGNLSDCIKWIEEAINAPDFKHEQSVDQIKQHLANVLPTAPPTQSKGANDNKISTTYISTGNNVCKGIRIIPKNKTR